MSIATLEKVSQLDQLREFTKVVADTGDFESMRAYQPYDATTNPSLIFAAIQKPEYGYLLDKAIADLKSSPLNGSAKIEAIIDRLLVLFGMEILQIVPGRVSTETDARLSFDLEGSINKGRQLIALYEQGGIAGTHLNKNRFHLGRHQGRGTAPKRIHQQQPDVALLFPSGRRLRRSWGQINLPLCWSHLRLV